MLKFIIVSALSVACVAAGGYGGSGRAASSGGARAASAGGYGSGSASGYGGAGLSSSGNGYGGGIIPAAIQTRHNIEYKDVPSTGTIQPATIEVGANVIPLNILFRSASSSLNVLQQHQGASGDTQETSSEDEPHRLLHTVTKPIIQEVREVISPFRKITQEIQPVQEEIQTIVARNTGFAGLGGASFDNSNLGANLAANMAVLSAGNSASSHSSSGGAIEIKATSGSGLGKGLSKSTSSSYGASAKASSGAKGY